MENDSEETILLTKDLATQAFAKWHQCYEDAGSVWDRGSAQEDADYFFDLVEDIATYG